MAMALVIATLLVAAWDFGAFLQRPNPAAAEVIIEKGWGLEGVAQALTERGVIDSPWWFMGLARWRGVMRNNPATFRKGDEY
ncbi:MAG: hypothetical protein HQL51_11750, partial [Magnetococcales bacterium]|nr:hypothetical protein [Magnetococcales bacterium]